MPGRLYIADYSAGTISRVRSNGTGLITLVSGLSTPRQVVYCQTLDKLWWTGNNSISVANGDGTGQTVIVNHGLSQVGLGVDRAGGYVFYGGGNPATRYLYRANSLTGAGEVNLWGDGQVGRVTTLVFDPTDRKVYWRDNYAGAFWRANVDGTGAEVIRELVTTLTPELAVDVAGRKVYYTNPDNETAYRMDMDGSNLETLFTVALSPGLLAIGADSGAGKIFWTEYTPKNIKSCNLDGTGVTVVWAGTTIPFNLWVEPAIQKWPTPRQRVTTSRV